MDKFDPSIKETPNLEGELEFESTAEIRKIHIAWSETIEYGFEIQVVVPPWVGPTDKNLREYLVNESDDTLWYRMVQCQMRRSGQRPMETVEAVQLLSIDPLPDE